MALAAAFALYTDNYSRFFERTDLIQSVFLANLFSIGLPFRDSNTFSYAFFFPYLMGNAIALAIGFLREKELGTKNVYIENFHNFFVESKISSISLFVAILFFLGTPPLHGIVWRIALINAVYDCGRIASMVAFIICFCSVGYVYFRWMLAIFQKNSRPRVEPMSSLRNRIDIFAVVCTLGVVFCSVFRQMSLTN
jgi:NADH:ubiquinone oxidoreductase subunit 2 (subunit N)